MWFINWGVACGCGNMVPETISKKLRPMVSIKEYERAGACADF